MDYYTACEEPESEIDLKQLLWSLLSQWKAILIVALALALIVSGVKLLKDTKSQQAAASARQEQARNTAELSKEERIQKVLSSLSTKERKTVEYITKQQEQVNAQQAYLNDSLLQNTDPTNQRTLVLNYYLQVDEGVEMQALADAYTTYLQDDSFITPIKEAIGLDIGPNLLRELISTSKSRNAARAPLDSGTKGSMFSVYVVLPENVDTDAVQEATKTVVDAIYESLNAALGTHSIKPTSSCVSYLYNSDTVDRKTALINNTNNIINSIKNASLTLSSEQKDAVATITAILEGQVDSSAQEDTDSVTGVKTASVYFSSKYALLGFTAGVVGYCVIYVAILALSKRVSTAENLQNHTMSRLLGDVYYSQPYEGLSKLFHSRLVDKYRYGSKGTVIEQAQKVVSNIESACEHNGSTDIVFLRVGCTTSAPKQIVEGIIADVKKRGIKTRMIEITDEIDEKALLDIGSAIISADDSAKTAKTWRLTQLCQAYDVRRLGCLYISRK